MSESGFPMLVANAGAVFASPEHGPSGGWVRRLDAQGAGCPQQSGQQRQQRGGAARGRALAGVGAAAARLLAPQLLAQDARVRGWAQAAHVVVARPSVLAVQELIVADIRTNTGNTGDTGICSAFGDGEIRAWTPRSALIILLAFPTVWTCSVVLTFTGQFAVVIHAHSGMEIAFAPSVHLYV